MTSDLAFFDLGPRHAATTDGTLLDHDEAHFGRIAASLRRTVDTLTDRLTALRRIPVGDWQQASDRDLEIRSVTSRLTVLQRYDRDLCLGRFVTPDGQIVYIGRIGILDTDGEQLLLDWRTPDAEAFFSATTAQPMGVQSRRRYRWSGGMVVDFWDEVLVEGDLHEPVAPDEDSAFISSLGARRSPRMRDVLGTIATDQDAAIRADSHGALVVDGGPGTGKTVVALHRAAYLLYADPRLRGHRGGILVVGPHEPYLAFVSDVLPSLGSDGAALCTIADLVTEGSTATTEPDLEVAALKGTVAMVDAIENAVRFYEEPPSEKVVVQTPWSTVSLTPDDWAEAFDAATGVPHNEAREQIWTMLTAIVRDALGRRLPGHRSSDDEDVDEMVRQALIDDDALVTTMHRAWPMLDARDIVGDLWTVPAFLRRCAPALSVAEVRRLQRSDAYAWTDADLPLLDAATRRLGDAAAAQRDLRRRRALAAQRDQMDDVVSDLIAAQEFDDGEGLMPMLRQRDLRDVLVDESASPRADPDTLAGPFAHVIVDEAQELTDAQWQMLLSRCPSASMTIVGDRAQARRGFRETWEQRLNRVGFDDIVITPLTVNYRTPAEIMAVAGPVIEAALPDANVPTSIRDSGIPVCYTDVDEAERLIKAWLAEHSEGTACVIGDPARPHHPRVRSLSPATAKGLEFDLVILMWPNRFGDGITGAVDRYVAMTRATSQLVIVG